MRRTATILFHARQQAHFWHLDTHSYAEHKALEQFYDELLELTDKLVEVYLGKGRKIDFKSIRMTFHDYNRENMIKYFKKLANYINRVKKSLKQNEGDLNNIFEEILAIINRTLYLFTLNESVEPKRPVITEEQLSNYVISEAQRIILESGPVVNIAALNEHQFVKLIDLLESDIKMLDDRDFEYYASETGIPVEKLLDMVAAYGYNDHQYKYTDMFKKNYSSRLGKPWDQIVKDADEANFTGTPEVSLNESSK